MGYGGLDTPLVRAATSLNDVDLVVDRDTGNISIANNDLAGVGIKGVSILSSGGAMKPAGWTSIADAYDEAPGNGSVDPDDPWTETSATVFDLSEAELSGGNGGTIAGSGTINLGSAWTKSRIEDVSASLTLADGSTEFLTVKFINGPGGAAYSRSDLNGDGAVNATDWPLYYPNMLIDLSSLTLVGKALAGDLDGDGDNDVFDFSLFKEDYDLANGAGAFAAMVAAVPEPASCALLLFGAIGAFAFRRRRSSHLLSVALGASAVLAIGGTASAVGVNLTTFTVESFPITTQGIPATWTITPSKAISTSNSDENVLYSTDSPLNNRYIGLLTPGTDDDVVGFVLGFEPGDAQFGSTADYLLIDWKGSTQSFNFADVAGNFFHDQTPAGIMPVGLALSRVTGLPNADELWQHHDYDPEAPDGTVTELARSATLGSTPYNRAGGSHLFDIRYTASNVTVLIDGVEQINLNGSFPDGRFGLYTAYQGPSAPSFANIEVVPATGWVGMSATVNQSTGEIILKNEGTAAVDFDYYRIDSAASSLNLASWNSLSDQDFNSTGGGNGQSWDEAGGSGNSALAEVNLLANTAFAGNTQRSLGNAYNNTLNALDLVVTYRLLSGLVATATVTYIGTPPGVPGDYNDNGVVDAADYVLWRKGGALQHEVATIGSNTPEDYTEWRARFGNPPGSGSALGEAQSVPEPATIGLLLCMGLALAARRARGRHR